MAKLYCRSCGVEVGRGTAFCPECGVRDPSANNPLSKFAHAPQGNPRGLPAPQCSKNQGLILGILGCCAGVLGILTFGPVFVPLAILLSLIGLLQAAIHRSGTGAAASLVGLTMSAIGFLLSPSLLLLAGGLFVASQSNSVPPPSPIGPNAVSDIGPVPALENQFCEVTANAATEYFRLMRDARKAKDDENGIVEKKAQDAMTVMARDRNNAVFKVVQSSNFIFESWRVQLLEIGKPSNGQLSFSVRPLCSEIVTIHLQTTAIGPAADALATTRRGDTLVLSGTFVEALSNDGTNVALRDPARFERSITERGSMEQPEYQAVLR